MGDDDDNDDDDPEQRRSKKSRRIGRYDNDTTTLQEEFAIKGMITK